MTYGWAILVVIIVGVVLWQMGIFNPSGGSAPGSTGFGSVRAKDWSCSITNGMSVQFVNGAGEKINVTSPTASGGTCTGLTGTSANQVAANGVFTCTWVAASPCANMNPGDRYEFTTDLVWVPASGVGISHIESGKVWKGAES